MPPRLWHGPRRCRRGFLMQHDGSPTVQETTPPDQAEAAISGRLRERLGEHRWGMWFDQGTSLRVRDGQVEVEAASQFVADWIGRNFRGELESAARAALGEAARVSFRVGGGPSDAPRGDDDDAARARARLRHAGGMTPPARLTAGPGADTDAAPARRPAWRTLEDFVVGDGNRVAWDAACRVASSPRAEVANLFVHGGCGLGKTHLLQGLCQRRRQLFPREHIRYTTGEQFTNEYIASVRAGQIDAFRARMRRLDLLAIDDVHFLANKTATQSEFTHTLDALDLTGRVVLASDEHPRQIRRFSQALVSRFMAGTVLRVDAPDRATRAMLAARLAARRGFVLGPEAADAVACQCVGSVREIEGALAKLAALHALECGGGAELPVSLVRRLFHEERRSATQGPVRFNDVVSEVCTRLGMTAEELATGGRHRRVVLARGLVVHLARELTTLSFPEIARALGREAHSSAHAADRRIRLLLEADATLLELPEGPASAREVVGHLRHALARGRG